MDQAPPYRLGDQRFSITTIDGELRVFRGAREGWNVFCIGPSGKVEKAKEVTPAMVEVLMDALTREAVEAVVEFERRQDKPKISQIGK